MLKADYMELSDDAPKSSVQQKQERNIKLMFLYSGLMSATYGIMSGGVFDQYIYLETSSNATVGWFESILGICQLGCAFPAGWLADKYPRDRLLIVAMVTGMVACAMTVYGILTDNLPLLAVSMAAFGVSFAVEGPTAYSLFSDSIPQGNRAKWMSRMTMVTSVASGSGPLVGIAMFLYQGDEWSRSSLHAVIIVSSLGQFLSYMFLYGWNDVRQRSSSSDSVLTTTSEDRGRKKLGPHAWLVPIVLSFNDIVMAIGAGMTVKFFPLFFANDYGFGPVPVQILFASYSVVMGPATWVCEKLASRIGRIQAGIVFQITGIVCLVLLAKLELIWLVVPVFLLRGAVQNAVNPIDASVIMDFVPTELRGRWSAIESIGQMTWTGSAVIGGYLCDSHDYRYSFLVTASVYAFALLTRIPLLWLVPKNEKFEVEKMEQAISEADARLLRSPHAPSVK